MTDQRDIVEQERQAFMKWLPDHLMPSEFSHSYLFKRDSFGDYENDFVNDAWEVWLARSKIVPVVRTDQQDIVAQLRIYKEYAIMQYAAAEIERLRRDIVVKARILTNQNAGIDRLRAADPDAGAWNALIEAKERAEAENERLRGVVEWVDSWVSNPVGSYSVHALDGLFRMTRDKIAELRRPQEET